MRLSHNVTKTALLTLQRTCRLSHEASSQLYAARHFWGHIRGTGFLRWGHRVLTDKACRQAKGAEKPYKLADAKGLYLYITVNGYRSWRWKYRIAGKEKRLTFGSYPDVSLAEARELREDAARLLRSGQDPSIHKRQQSAAHAARHGATFQMLAEDWMASQQSVWSAKHATNVRRSLEKDVFPRIGTLPIDTITTPIVLATLRPIEKRGAIETAHRTRQRVSEVFGWAIGSGVAVADPAAVTKRGLSRIRRGKFPAVRTVEAAQALLRKVEIEPAHPLTKLASRFLALTAVRSGAVRLAEASEFEDLDGVAPIWRIPAAKMKLVTEQKADVAFEFIVPLAPQTVEIVRIAMELSGTAPLLFRSVRSARRPISDSTISKLYRAAGFSGVHVPHGWRSTFSTVMNELAGEENRAGDREVIDLMLAHVQKGVEPLYNRASYMPRRRQIACEWADMLSDGLADPRTLIEGPRRA
nr:integrase arm-type DNA-binding domain-containing protein [Sphingomonas sp. Mn802worker]